MLMEQYVVNISGKVRRESKGGKSYLVAPMTLIVPGVLNGSQGALFYPPEEVRRNPQIWSGTPIVVYHPQVNGMPVSARDPDILATQGIGIVLHPTANEKLKAEGWFDEQKTAKVDQRVLEALNQRMEISTGLFTDNLPVPGVFNGTSYNFVARNYRPDHLAILPDKVGACSLDAGCGLNVNHRSEELVLNCGCGPECGCLICQEEHNTLLSLESVVAHLPALSR